VAPSRSKAPPTSLLGRLPKAEAVALVVLDDKLELVAAQPSGWRLELATGKLEHVTFEPASGLVFFYRDRSVWAIDLLEPLASEASRPAIVELARSPVKAPSSMPAQVSLCFPHPEYHSEWQCWPEKPLPSDLDSSPEWLEIAWSDEPAATWHVPLEQLDDEEADSQYDHVSLKMVGREWLRARADRRQHFASVTPSVHSFWDAKAMPGAPAFGERCLDPEHCGKSLPLGTSGWEWVVVGSDMYHPYFAVYDPAKQRWANWTQLLAGTAAWVPTAELPQGLEGLGEENHPLFDGRGRVFASPSSQQLCWFRFDAQAEVASAVDCEDVGGSVVGFLSVSTELGLY
jgi:hypothetical protein